MGCVPQGLPACSWNRPQASSFTLLGDPDIHIHNRAADSCPLPSVLMPCLPSSNS